MSTSGEKSSERSSRQRGSSECKPLIDAATKDLFRKNAFRITGLSVDATTREVAKHADKIKMLAELGQDAHAQNSAFPINPSPSLDDIREAIQKLKDPEKRLIDEFFWFWPEEFGQGQSDPAIQALGKGDSKTAIDIWSAKEKSPTDGVVASHNLALVFHICALDWENHSAKNEVGAELRQKNSDYWWKGAFDRWERLATDETFWEKVTARIRQLNEPNLPTGFARRMRATLPEALDKINAELAVAFAESGKIELARLHIRFMRETHPGLDDVEKTAELVLTPARNRLKEQIQRAQERAKQNANDAASAARELVQQAQRALLLFDLFFGKEGDLRNDLFDEVATVCNRLQVAHHKATSDDNTCLEILHSVLPLATSIELRQQIEENIGVLTGFVADKKFEPVYALLKSIQDSKDSPSVRLARFKHDAIPAIVEAAGTDDYSQSYGYLSSALADFKELFDSAAIVLRGISLDAWNNHQDRQTAVAANKLAVRHATSPELKQRLEEDKATLQQMGAQASGATVAPHEESNNTIGWRSFSPSARAAVSPREESNISRLGCLVLVAIVIGLGVIGSCNSTTNSSSSNSYTPPLVEAVSPPPVVSRQLTSSSNDIFDRLTINQPQFTPPPTTPNTRSTYQVSQNASTELDRDKQAIESEKAKSERLEGQLAKAKVAVETQKADADELGNQLEILGRQIERERNYLDQTSQSDLDDFNRKVNRYNAALKNVRAENELANQLVDGYNALLEQMRAQNRKVNQMVDNYNAKLQRYGR